jgi:peptide/nickel transport system permease protein
VAGYVALRAVRSAVTLWLVVTVVFVGLRLNGDPASALLPDDASVEQVEAFRRLYGLDDAIPVQYARYLAALASGEFGSSLQERRPVVELVGGRVAATLELGLAAVAIAIALGVPAGIVAALRRNTPLDRLLMGVAFLGQSAPNFFVGIVLILLMSLQLRLLPSGGRDGWLTLVLPAFTLATGLLAGLARMTRASLLDVIRQQYVLVAYAKGLSTRQVVVRHALRNAAIPVLTIFGLSVGTLIGGAAIVETVFAWPGVGRLAVSAISVRDYPVIQFIVLMVAASVVTVSLLVDVAYGLLDPRIRQLAA